MFWNVIGLVREAILTASIAYHESSNNQCKTRWHLLDIHLKFNIVVFHRQVNIREVSYFKSMDQFKKLSGTTCIYVTLHLGIILNNIIIKSYLKVFFNLVNLSSHGNCKPDYEIVNKNKTDATNFIIFIDIFYLKLQKQCN